MIHDLFDKLGGPLLFLLFVLLFYAESKFKLRKRVQNRLTRIVINVILSIPAFALLRVLLIPAMVWLAVKNESLHVGLLYLFTFPVWLEAAFAFILLDYASYTWHILLHKLPFLWRFHLVHHTDLDLDVTTAFRFHFGEIIGSVFFRGAAVFLTGASPVLVLIYEIVFEAATQFHHSNMKLPIPFERLLNKIVVTPRMHGIHHSVIKKETDSNYSVVLSIWDRLHRTVRLNIHQDDLIIGVPSYQDEHELTIGRLLTMPFKKTRDWNGTTRSTTGDPRSLKP